jgi:tRNA A-37 threonylcarbamoyl transferase component Bud32
MLPRSFDQIRALGSLTRHTERDDASVLPVCGNPRELSLYSGHVASDCLTPLFSLSFCLSNATNRDTMSHKIQCPHCKNAISIKPNKVGRFKPTCSKCQQSFVLEVRALDPIDVRVAASSSSSARTAPDANKRTETDTTKKPQISVDATTEQPASVLSSSKGSKGESKSLSSPAIDETMASDSSRKTQRDLLVDATVDAPPSSSASSRSRSPTEPSGSQVAIQRLGGYRILEELGRGGMGSVYLAKQLSLDRSVALKTIQTEWASNPRVIARFIREAYAAAQLTHHNVVQIYDLGEDTGTNFFSMELVGGGSLDDLIKKSGRLEPKTAACFIAQAARGLKFAHDNGMIHRDIKPANLMLTSDGIVKVADMGLVKTPQHSVEEGSSGEDQNILLASARSQVTGQGSTLGTPAYMSPEQAEDATNVDLRADIYSLGCTFYALLTGRPPFQSDSALEIITKHKTEPLIRPDKVVEGIPSQLASIVEKMTAKKPQDRYQNLSGVIDDIESFLGTDSGKPFAPAIERAERIQQANDAFNNAPLAKLRGIAPIAFALVTLALAGGLWFFDFRLALTALSLLVLTPIAVAVLTGLFQSDSPVVSRYRALLFGSRITDWVTWGIGGLLFLVILAALGMLPHAIIALVLSVAIGFAYQHLCQQSLRRQRDAAIGQAESLLRELRVGGLPEHSIQQFVAEYSGKNWEEFFETLFDYDSMRAARNALSESGKGKGKQRFRTWRDALVQRIDARLLQQKLDREQKVLFKVEQAGLKATGMSDADAKKKAEQMAATMVTVASEVRQTMAELSFGQSDAKAIAKRERIKAMLTDARSGHAKQGSRFVGRATTSLVSHLLGGKLRFALGGLMIAGCALWAQQNDLLDPENVKQIQKAAEPIAAQASDALKSGVVEGATSMANDAQAKLSKIGSQLKFDTRPWAILPFFDSFAPGVIGLLILLSSVIYGWRYSLFAIAAAAVCLFGSGVGVPSLGPIPSHWISAAAAAILLVVGLALGRMPQRSTS